MFFQKGFVIHWAPIPKEISLVKECLKISQSPKKFDWLIRLDWTVSKWFLILKSLSYLILVFKWLMGYAKRTYIIDKNKFRKSYFSYWNWQLAHPWNQIPTNKQKTHHPWKLIAPPPSMNIMILQSHSNYISINHT